MILNINPVLAERVLKSVKTERPGASEIEIVTAVQSTVEIFLNHFVSLAEKHGAGLPLPEPLDPSGLKIELPNAVVNNFRAALQQKFPDASNAELDVMILEAARESFAEIAKSLQSHSH